MGKSGIRAQQCFRGRRSLSDLKKDLIQKLIELRAQGMVIADINPISALADDLSHRLYRGTIDLEDISALINNLRKRFGLTRYNHCVSDLEWHRAINWIQPIFLT